MGPLEPTPWGAPVSDLPPLPDPARRPPPRRPRRPPLRSRLRRPPPPPAGPPPVAAPAGAVAALAGGPVVTGLAAPATVPAATAARAGLIVRFAVPAGATSAAIRVLATRGPGPLTVIAKQTVRVRRGVNRVALNGKALRRRLKRGKVVVEVRLKRAGGGVGAPKRTVVRIV